MCCISLKSQRFLMDYMNIFYVDLDLGDATTPSNTQSKSAEGEYTCSSSMCCKRNNNYISRPHMELCMREREGVYVIVCGRF